MTRTALALALVLAGCGGDPPLPEPPPAVPASAPPSPTPVPETTRPAEATQPGGSPASGAPSKAAVDQRVQEASERLLASDGGRLVWDAIEAHGGLAGWLGAGSVAFTFDYAPLGKPEARRYTRSRVDLWRARAVQEELGEGADARFGWNGEEAWITPSPEAFPSSVRFWATTPYYFVGIPFVLADPGARFAVLPDAELDGVAHHLVKVTYEEGTGDSPDDYYIVYLHPETRRVAALRYVVAYPARFEKGQHSPEKLMKLGPLEEVGPLRFPTTLHTHAWDPESGVGEQVTAITVSDVVLGEPVPGSAFDPPEGAVVSKEL